MDYGYRVGFRAKTATVKRASEKNGHGKNGNRKIGQPKKSATKIRG